MHNFLSIWKNFWRVPGLSAEASAKVEAEARLIFLNQGERKRMIEEAEDSEGKMKADPEKDPLKFVRLNTERLGRRITQLTPSWCDQLFHLGGARKDMVEQRILDEAERRIRMQGDLAGVRLTSIFHRAERKLLLRQTALQITRDLRKYIEHEQQELETERDRYSRLAAFLGSGTGAISLKELKSTRKVAAVLSDVETKYQTMVEKAESSGKGLPEEWESGRMTELFLRQQLIEQNVVKPEDLNRLLLDNVSLGSKELEKRISTCPTLKDRKNERDAMVRAVRKLREKSVRGYRLLQAKREDTDVGPLEQRMQFLEREGFPSRRLALSLGGRPFTATVVARRPHALILKDPSRPGKDGYLVFDTQAAMVTLRNSSGARKLVDYDLRNTQNTYTILS